MSDFKSNDNNLIGGKYFEPHEENPMIGFRVLSLLQRFYRKGFALECEDEKCETKCSQRKLMIPFAEPWKKEKSIGRNGRQQISSRSGLEVYV
jgi:pyruvate,water dikinase